MSNLNQTPMANRIHIGFFGKRNSGKSSLINAFVNQEVSIVSNQPGTTTDPVYKAMEIHGIGPCVLIDTAGFDDQGILGQLRNEKTIKTSDKIDIAVIVFNDKNVNEELRWWKTFEKKNVPVIPVISKIDLGIDEKIINLIKNEVKTSPILTSSHTKEGLLDLKEILIRKIPNDFEKKYILNNLIKPQDIVVLVMPQDLQAPKGRLILPQVQVIRELLDRQCIPIATTCDNLKLTLNSLNKVPDLIITDSQVFKDVYQIIPKTCRLTSFSVLMAGYKGDLRYYISSVKKLAKFDHGAHILISESCSHAPLSEDIGRVKIPKLLIEKFGITNVDIANGSDFPDDIDKYDLIISCGGCMLNRRAMMARVNAAKEKYIPMTNYGIFIAYVNDILDKIVY